MRIISFVYLLRAFVIEALNPFEIEIGAYLTFNTIKRHRACVCMDICCSHPCLALKINCIVLDIWYFFVQKNDNDHFLYTHFKCVNDFLYCIIHIIFDKHFVRIEYGTLIITLVRIKCILLIISKFVFETIW